MAYFSGTIPGLIQGHNWISDLFCSYSNFCCTLHPEGTSETIDLIDHLQLCASSCSCVSSRPVLCDINARVPLNETGSRDPCNLGLGACVQVM